MLDEPLTNFTWLAEAYSQVTTVHNVLLWSRSYLGSVLRAHHLY